MAFENCIAEIKKAAGGALTDEQAAQIMQDLLDRQQAVMRRSGGTADPSAALKLAAKELTEEEAAAAAVERRNARLNLAARTARRARIETRAAELAGDGKPRDFATAVRAEMHGINTPIKGGKFSAEAEWKALNRVYQVGLERVLEREGLFEVARDGKLEREWARELFELSKGKDGTPGLTKSPEALKIAQAIHRFETLAKTRLNEAGAWIGDYSGYIARTSHDPDKIRRAGFDPWRTVALKTLDQERTFAGLDRTKGETPDDFLRNVYHGLVTGVHLTDGQPNLKDPAFTGPGNLARKLSQDRVLHFKGADAWLDYNRQFGIGRPIESVIHSLDRAARQTALLRRWGTNPRAEFEQDMRALAAKFRNSDPTAVNKLQRQAPALWHVFDFLDGTAERPVNRIAARISSGARIWESMSKLGGVLFTHFSVLGTKPAELNFRGVGLLQGYGDSLASILRGRGSGTQREIMDTIGAGLEGMHRDILSRFTPDDGMPGTLSKLANTFFKWTGLTYMFNAQKRGAEQMMALHLGNQLAHDFKNLPAGTARSLKAIGLEAKEWDLLRAAPDHVADDSGRVYLTPDAAERMDDAKVATHLRDTGAIEAKAKAPAVAAAVARFKEDTAMRLYAYYVDTSERAIITPGIAEKAILLQGQPPGTPLGEGLRFIAQFKQWPAAAIRQGLGRELYGRAVNYTGQDKLAATAGVLHMALASTILGYLAMTAKDLAKGRTPRVPTDLGSAAKIWAASMMQGGGIGILGDFLFGEYDRFGHDWGSTALGPVLGEGIGDVLQLYNDAKNGDKRGFDAWWRRLAAEGLRDTTDNMPFVNLFYTRLALNYLFLWQAQEALNPGFLRRSEARIRQQNNQGFLVSPRRSAHGR